jgi:monovalent cation:H+ antiporter-2, CPA2 family
VEHTAALVLEVGAILLAAAGAGWVARRLTLPAIVGYLAVGLAVSPFTPGYVADRGQVSLFAELGAILLLFEVGIEVDLRELRREHPAMLWAVPVQMAVTFGASLGAFAVLGLDISAAALLGLAIAMSSSVVVVNITRSRRRTTDPETEHLLIGWSVLQDVIGVGGAIILLAVLGAGRPIYLVVPGLAAFAAVAVGTSWLLPRVLARVRREPDLFLAVSVATGLTVAGAGALLSGIPLALAAFIAGVTISEGPVASEARRRLLPFRDLFAIFFFVAIGTLIDPGALGRGLGWLALCLALVLLAKSAVILGLGRLAGLPAHHGQLAVGLGQVGEFGFVLATVAVARGVLPSEVYAALLAAVAISIALSSIAVRLVAPGRAGQPFAGA